MLCIYYVSIAKHSVLEIVIFDCLYQTMYSCNLDNLSQDETIVTSSKWNYIYTIHIKVFVYPDQ